MKRVISIILCCLIAVTGCYGKQQEISIDTGKIVSKTENDNNLSNITDDRHDIEGITEVKQEVKEDDIPDDIDFSSFSSVDDPIFLQYITDDLYFSIEELLSEDDYEIEDIQAVYLSNEYLEELQYNSMSNIFFGYSLEDITSQYKEDRFVFTVGDDGKTAVEPFEEYTDHYYEEIIKDVAIGTGIILVTVIVSVATGGAAAAPTAGAVIKTVHTIFSLSAKSATTWAIQQGVVSGVQAGIVTGIKTKDFNSALKDAAISASEGFKWGAISGTVVGGIKGIRSAVKAANQIPSWQESEKRALKKYGGEEQKSFLKGKEVPQNTPGAVRPDLYDPITKVATEVKRYDLSTKKQIDNVCNKLLKQVRARVDNLPEGSTQRVVFDVKGRNYSKSHLREIEKAVKEHLQSVYENISIDFMI